MTVLGGGWVHVLRLASSCRACHMRSTSSLLPALAATEWTWQARNLHAHNLPNTLQYTATSLQRSTTIDPRPSVRYKMPSRKSRSSSIAADSGRSTMRRLSSIASLHQLLPFARSRRSNPDSDPLSHSEDSFSSSTVNLSTSSNSSWTHDSDHGRKSLLPSSSTATSGNADHPSKADQPTTKLPRSRTLSNLPVAMWSRDKGHRRQATAAIEEKESVIAPLSSRLPTPTTSSRRYFAFGHRTDSHSNRSMARTKLKRSDTEPLLTVELARDNAAHRATAFKENLAPGSESTMSAFESVSSGLSSVDPTTQHGRTSLPRDHSFCGAIPTTPTKSWSDPASVPDKTPTQRSYLSATAPVVRSHPALVDITNAYHERDRDTTVATRQGKAIVRTPFADHATYNTIRSSKALRVVLDAQPTSYWSGRLSSLLDRYQGQELFASIESAEGMAMRTETDKLHAPSASVARTRRAFEELYSTCATDEAKESFIAFQMQYAALQNDPQLAKSVGPRPMYISLNGSGKSTKTASTDLGSQSSGSGRKVSFVDRLLGRHKRNSLA